MRRVLASALCACLLASGGPLLAAPAYKEGPLELNGSVDWSARVIRFRASIDGRAAGLRLPAARIEAERAIEAALPSLAKELLFSIQVDAQRTVLDTIADGSVDVDAIIGALEARRRVSGSFSRDFSSFAVDFELDLGALEALYVRHSRPIRRPPSLEWAPADRYTGILVYAALPLPLRGGFEQESLRPCLFPRLWDDAMGSVLEPNMVAPEAIAAWGVAGYTRSPDSAELEARVGDAPLRASARGVFGEGLTDLILSLEDVRRIFGSEENRKLIEAGRVMIVVPPSAVD